MSTSWTYVTGGTLAPDAPSYVERRADRDLLESLGRGETCYVLNSRQMGKSSLCVRTIGRLKEAGVRTAFLDLTKFGGRNLTAEQWYAALLSEVGRDLGLRSEFLTYWKENAGLPPVQRLFGAITELGLRDSSPLVVFIDEIDVTLSLPFSADEFFAAIRQCYVGRATDEKLKRLAFCLLGTATPADLIQDTRVSPFNIGRRIELSDFTDAEASPLAAGLGDSVLLRQVLHWTGGHPYLTQRLCQAVRESDTRDVDKVCSDLFLTHSAKDSDDNLAFVRNRLLKSEADLAALLDLYRQMREGRSVPDDETNPLCAMLKLSGVARVEAGKLKVRNRIYEHVFDREWVETHMPDAEKRRQKEAFWTGFIRASTAAIVALGIVSFFAVKSVIAERETNAIRKNLDYQLYVSKINNLQSIYDEGDFGRATELLAETKSSPHRGWEWGYWFNKVHDSAEEYQIDSIERDATAYGSYFSKDGSQIIISDRKLGVAVLLDRKSKSVIARYTISPDEDLYRAGTKWLAVSNRYDTKVRDIVTDKLILHVDRLQASDAFSAVDEDSGLLIRTEWSSEQNARSSVYSTVSGNRLWSGITSRSNPSQILDISTEGTRQLSYSYKVSNGYKAAYQIVDQNKGTLDIFETTFLFFQPALSSSGQYWVCADSEFVYVRETSERRTVLKQPRGTCSGAVFDRTGKYLISKLAGNRVEVRQIRSGQLVSSYGGANYVRVSPATDELMLIGNSVRIVPIVTPRASELRGSVGQGKGSQVVFSAPASQFFEFRDDASLELKRGPIRFNSGSLLSRNGQLIATPEETDKGKLAILRDTNTKAELLRSKQLWQLVEAPILGRNFATLSSDGNSVHCYRRGEQSPIWKVLGSEIYGIAFSSDGSRFLLKSKLKIQVHDGMSGKLLKTVPGFLRGAGFIGATPAIWIGDDSRIDLLHPRTFHVVATINQGCQGNSPLAVSPDGKRFAIADDSGGVAIWDSSNSQRLLRLSVSDNPIDTLLFTSDGRTLIASNTDETVRLFQSTDRDTIIRISHTHSRMNAKE